MPHFLRASRQRPWIPRIERERERVMTCDTLLFQFFLNQTLGVRMHLNALPHPKSRLVNPWIDKWPLQMRLRFKGNMLKSWIKQNLPKESGDLSTSPWAIFKWSQLSNCQTQGGWLESNKSSVFTFKTVTADRPVLRPNWNDSDHVIFSPKKGNLGKIKRELKEFSCPTKLQPAKPLWWAPSALSRILDSTSCLQMSCHQKLRYGVL